MPKSTKNQQYLILQEIVSQTQTYRPETKPEPEEVLRHIQNSRYLSDRTVEVLKNSTLEQHPDIKGRKGYQTLDEFTIRDKKYGLGNLLVIIQYDFANDAPRIMVPGKNPELSEEKGKIEVTILDNLEQIKFAEGILLKKYDVLRENKYTGNHLVWPGMVRDIKLRTRKIKI